MKSMFSRLFCGVMFVAAVLGNVVMAKNKYIDETLIELINAYTGCGVYSEQCLVEQYNILDDESIKSIIDTYFRVGENVSDMRPWFYTIAKTIQGIRLQIHEHNKKTRKGNVESPLDRYTEFRIYADGPSMTDKFCSMLMLGYLFEYTPIGEYMASDYVSKAKMREIYKNSMGLNRACDYTYGVDGEMYFDVRWDSYEFRRLVDYNVKLVEEIENEQY